MSSLKRFRNHTEHSELIESCSSSLLPNCVACIFSAAHLQAFLCRRPLLLSRHFGREAGKRIAEAFRLCDMLAVKPPGSDDALSGKSSESRDLTHTASKGGFCFLLHLFEHGYELSILPFALFPASSFPIRCRLIALPRSRNGTKSIFYELASS